jgi:hypothetical protein
MPIGWVTVNGQRLPVEVDMAYWKWMHHHWEDRMGGLEGPSMTEVQTNVVETKAQAVNAIVQAAAVGEMAATNAEALKATVQVTQTNSLAGSDQIPEVILRAPNKLYTDTFN